MRILVCASGALGMIGLTAILKSKGSSVVGIMTDRHSTEIFELASQRNIPVFAGNPRKEDVVKGLPRFDVLLSINYLFILPEKVINKAVKVALNIHGSLLPKYMGRTPMTWAIIHDEVETGITVHRIIADCDCGPIVYQEKIPISNTDTAGTLLQEMGRRYPLILGRILGMISKGVMREVSQDIEKRIYCGKRTPEDGLIDWRWSSRKVYNWVRALTRPYPGAFCFYNGRKCWVWRVEEVLDQKIFKGRRLGFPFRYKNGLYVRCGVGGVLLNEVEGLFISLESRRS